MQTGLSLALKNSARSARQDFMDRLLFLPLSSLLSMFNCFHISIDSRGINFVLDKMLDWITDEPFSIYSSFFSKEHSRNELSVKYKKAVLDG